jgi:hypothetical protein
LLVNSPPKLRSGVTGDEIAHKEKAPPKQGQVLGD